MDKQSVKSLLEKRLPLLSVTSAPRGLLFAFVDLSVSTMMAQKVVEEF